MDVKGTENTSSRFSNSRTKRRLADYFLQNKTPVDYRNSDVLRRFLSPEGKILPARRSGLTSRNQRKLTLAVKQARMIGLLPFTDGEF